jgi:hypothetical protein
MKANGISVDAFKILLKTNLLVSKLKDKLAVEGTTGKYLDGRRSRA